MELMVYGDGRIQRCPLATETFSVVIPNLQSQVSFIDIFNCYYDDNMYIFILNLVETALYGYTVLSSLIELTGWQDSSVVEC